MTWKQILACIAAVLSLAFVAGCGDDDDDDGGGGDALSAEEYSSQIDDELAAFNEEFTALGQEAASPESRQDYLDAVTAVQDRVGETVDALGGVEPPEDAAEFHDGLITAMEGLEASFQPVIDATEANDRGALLQAAHDLQESTTEFGESANQLAADAEEAGLDIPNLAGTGG
jgi:hypothetical protein